VPFPCRRPALLSTLIEMMHAGLVERQRAPLYPRSLPRGSMVRIGASLLLASQRNWRAASHAHKKSRVKGMLDAIRSQ
jgi:hypothetical protein